MSRGDIARRYEDFDLDMEANTAFPSKLFQMLENSSDTEVIGWLDNGLSFAIFDQARFADLLPQYFKHKKISSFQRQLNLYGFRRDKQQSSYFHPKFQRGRRDLLSGIKRLPNKGNQKPEGGMYVETVKDGDGDYFPPRINLRARPDGSAREGTDSSGRVLRKLPNTWMNVHHHVTGAQGASVKRDREDEPERGREGVETNIRSRVAPPSPTSASDSGAKDMQAKARANRSAERAEKKAKMESDFSFARITDGDSYNYSIKNPIKRIPLVSDSEAPYDGATLSTVGSTMVTKKSKVTANIGYYEMLRTGSLPSAVSADVMDGEGDRDGQTLPTGGVSSSPMAIPMAMTMTSRHSDDLLDLQGNEGVPGASSVPDSLSLDVLAGI